MMDNSNPGSRDLVVLPTGLAHTVMYAYKYTVAVVAARVYRYTHTEYCQSQVIILSLLYNVIAVYYITLYLLIA